MKKLYLLLICCLLALCFHAEAQSTIHFKFNQPLPLLVDAGADTIVVKGEPVRLGGAATASGGTGGYVYTWTPSKGLDRTDVANPVATPDSTTTYTLSVTDATGCAKAATVTVTVNTITGISDPENELGIAIYPNPNSGTFFITSEQELDRGGVLVEIYDPLGRFLHRELVDTPGRKLDLSIRLQPYSRGLLFLRLSGSRISIIQKVIVQ